MESEEFEAVRRLATDAISERLETLEQLGRRVAALEQDRDAAVAAVLALMQPRVVVCGQVPGQMRASRHAAPCEGLIAVDVATRRLLVCAEGRWWQAPLKPAAPFDDIDPALESALAAIAAREAPLKPADTED